MGGPWWSGRVTVEGTRFDQKAEERRQHRTSRHPKLQDGGGAGGGVSKEHCHYLPKISSKSNSVYKTLLLMLGQGKTRRALEVGHNYFSKLGTLIGPYSTFPFFQFFNPF